MEGGSSVQASYVFRGIEYIVTMMVTGDVLEVEVEDRLTSEQWRGEFEAVYIEDVTHKTGNFKQFSIFCNMLESAITKSSESVTLDLLTYADLELLRNRKAGVSMRHAPPPKSGALNVKRYLILIYSVEFDRIHYPLPLPYVGKPDPATLQKIIRSLKEELATVKSKHGKDFRDTELRRLRAEFEKLLQEKQELEVMILQLQDQMKLSSTASVAKEVKILKKIIQSLEEELMKEKTKNQRAANKRNQEYRQVLDELEDVKASERKLKVRMKNLTTELNLYKRGRLTPVGPSPQNRSNLTLSSGHRSQTRTDSAGRVRQDGQSALRERSKQWSGSQERERSTSRERSGRWSSFRERERSSSRDSQQRNRSRTPRLSPSPAGTRQARFDPTAYVHNKEQKQKETEQRNLRRIYRGMNLLTGEERGRSKSKNCSREGSASKVQTSGHSRGRSSSAEFHRSRFSSASSLSDFEDRRGHAKSRLHRSRKPKRPLGLASWSSPNLPQRKPKAKKRLASTPTKQNKVSDKAPLLGARFLLESKKNRAKEPSAVQMWCGNYLAQQVCKQRNKVVFMCLAQL
ncbi:centrosomal protein CCDC61 isoform X1 [Hemiscyllium ocellatum]|uniref:centrosomal protein CCDC61 isoform X1 n=1 Tax=Hemiscyllium ocellatum TaxID=170820 RepID=UPI0029670176|nr:centrosomal protein CCDC61 isoform X1 [Hemiscyllium ocellatum]